MNGPSIARYGTPCLDSSISDSSDSFYRYSDSVNWRSRVQGLAMASTKLLLLPAHHLLLSHPSSSLAHCRVSIFIVVSSIPAVSFLPPSLPRGCSDIVLISPRQSGGIHIFPLSPNAYIWTKSSLYITAVSYPGIGLFSGCHSHYSWMRGTNHDL